MKAWQRVRREECAATDPVDGLWGEWWRDVDTSIDKAEVREISKSDAAPLVEKYEWMRSMPAVVMHCFGVFFGGAMGGVVVYSPEYGENLGVWDEYGYTGRIILLSRGVTLHWAHPHTSSYLIRRSMRLLPERYEVVTATVDPLAGEVGTVYQASGWDYVAPMRTNHHGLWEWRGRMLGERQLRRAVGGAFDAGDVEAFYPGARYVSQEPKGRYFAFRSKSKKQRIRDKAAIAHLIRPYPKRAAGVGETSLASSEEVLGQYQPAAPLSGAA